MTATLLEALHNTPDPRRRAARLNDIADTHELSGLPTHARLIRLVAATETLLYNPDHELEDDSAWDVEAWWQLAATRNRHQRADLLCEIWRDWAFGEFGDVADVLLEIAETERAAADDDLDTMLAESQESLIADLDERFPPEAGLADLYERAAPTPPAADDEEDQAEPEPAAAPGAPALPKSAGIAVTILVAVVAVSCVAAPQTPLGLRVGCAITLAIGVFVWIWRRSSR